jgi:hypothetical protein
VLAKAKTKAAGEPIGLSAGVHRCMLSPSEKRSDMAILMRLIANPKMQGVGFETDIRESIRTSRNDQIFGCPKLFDSLERTVR